MIDRVEIENFRGFRSLRLADCRRINILVGANASGKTSLLEGLFLASGGTPELALRLRQWRGAEQNFFGGGLVNADFLWNDLFHNFDREKAVFIKLFDPTSLERSLRIFYTGEETATVPSYNPGIPQPTPSPVSFEWQTPSGTSMVTPLLGQMGNLAFTGSAKVDIENYFFSSGGNYSSAETANRFSQLSQNFREKRVVELFLKEFPQIKNLSVEIFNGVSSLAGSMNGIPRKIPLSLISGGVNKFATLLCCLQYQPGTVLFVDEIENGFYYDRLESSWRAIRELADENRAQVFASSHSAECLDAAYEVAKEYPEDFSFIHLGQNQVKQFYGKEFIFSIEEGIEIR